MVYASIIVEALRSRPVLVFWLAALTQAALWLIVPMLFYSAPPGHLADVLAIGHEMRLGTVFGPPLAYWLADAAVTLAGGRLLGAYLLAQLCVVVALWSLLALGRDIVGLRHSVLAVFLLVGVSAANVATPDFGPAVLAMPLWSLTLLHAWRAVGQGRRRSWFVVSITVGLLLLTTYFAPVLLLLLVLFLLASQRGRASVRALDSWLCIAMVAIIVLPYGAWLSQQHDMLRPALAVPRNAEIKREAIAWLRLLGGILLAHSGIVLLVALAGGWPFDRRRRVPIVEGTRDDPLGTRYVMFFAIMPALLGTLILALYQAEVRLVTAAPLTVLSGLAVVALAGATIHLHRQRTLAMAWIGLLIAPPIMIALAVVIVPRLLPVDLSVAQPAAALAAYFSDTFQRRTGQPLAIIAGDRRLASLIAASAESRPQLYIDEKTTPWLTQEDFNRRGVVVVWPATDTAGTPPPEIRARFPTLVLEVPRIFERPLQGIAPPLRVGWAMIRPGISNQGSGIR